MRDFKGKTLVLMVIWLFQIDEAYLTKLKSKLIDDHESIKPYLSSKMKENENLLKFENA